MSFSKQRYKFQNQNFQNEIHVPACFREKENLHSIVAHDQSVQFSERFQELLLLDTLHSKSSWWSNGLRYQVKCSLRLDSYETIATCTSSWPRDMA